MQAFVGEVFANNSWNDECLVLDKFVNLLVALDGQQAKDSKITPEFAAKAALFEMAKYHNKFSQIDELVREFARIISVTDSDLAGKLETVLNMPIAIKNEDSAKAKDSFE